MVRLSIHKAVVIAGLAMGVGISLAQPVLAEDWDRGRREDDHGRWERDGREREWREREWREHHHYAPPPVVYSAPPAAAYYPPPVVAAPPAGISIVLPLNFR